MLPLLRFLPDLIERPEDVGVQELTPEAAVQALDVLADLKADGHNFTRDQVTRVSPDMTKHLKYFGQYVLDSGDQPPPLEPKSLDLVDEESSLR